MNRLLLLLMMTALPLWQSCGSTQFMEKANRTAEDVQVVAARVKAVSDALPVMKEKLDAKLDQARADLAAKGAPVEGTPAELAEWAKQNPGTAFSSLGGFLMVLAAAAARYRTAKKAAIVAVDAVEALPPDAKKAFKAEAETNAHMTAGVASFITALKNR